MKSLQSFLGRFYLIVIKQKFKQDTWLNLVANTIAKQLKSDIYIYIFLKSVHPFTKSDNVVSLLKNHLFIYP